jgi:uncharacterized protein YjbI with pentapeptide repeats
MPEMYSNENLQKASFKNKILPNANFSGSDLRGADFTGSDLSGADFSNVRTGMTTVNAIWLFIASLVVSLFAGYLATLVGRTLSKLLESNDSHIRIAGIVSIVLIVIFILYAIWKGGSKSIFLLIIPAVMLALVSAVVFYASGLGTGKNMLYIALSFFLLLIMFNIGTIARTAAGNLSNILFIIVALSGGIFSKTLGGGIGTLVMAISCAVISKRALAGAEGFSFLKKTALLLTSKLGTSFRDAQLAGANFSGSKIHNEDFTGADIASVNWADATRFNCKHDNEIVTDKKNKKHG